MPDGLERSYRRLLWAYPRFYRRRRGLEMLTTLMEAAQPGQTRATGGEAAHLILSGLRVRLVPPGWTGKTAAGIVTLWGAIVLSGAGAYAAWSVDAADRARLDDPVIATLSDEIVGQPAARVDFAAGDPLDLAYSYKSRGEFQTLAAEGWEGPDPVPMGQSRFYSAVDPSFATLTRAYQRLRDGGWETGVTSQLHGCRCRVLWASRDGLLLRIASTTDSDRQTAVDVHAYQAAPMGVPAVAPAGFALGLVAFWPLMTWLAHHLARTPRRERLVIVLIGLPVLYACVANTVDTVLTMTPDPGNDARMLTADLMYPLANQAANPLAAIVVALGLAAAVGVLAPRASRDAS